MAKNHIVKFRVTGKQHEQIKQDAEQQGYKRVSSYMRHLSLERDLNRELWIERTLAEIHRKVMHK